jgi:HlyD family secretion protein
VKRIHALFPAHSAARSRDPRKATMTHRPVFAFALLLACLLAACSRHDDATMLGTLEWDRVSAAAEVSEPIVQIAVKEGDAVRAGDAILELDPRRTDADLAQAKADASKAEAALAELRHGTRIETIDAARATLAGTQATVVNAKRERDRIADIRKRGLVAQADLDNAETALRTATAQANNARANLTQLLNGTRIEEIDQAEAALAAAQASVRRLSITRERLDVRAPVDGRVDALPFKLGDQPPLGATVMSMLSGPAPYARIYVPASRRAHLSDGASCRVHVEGVDAPFAATIRSVRSDPAFTPYFALTGDDASRLSYRAELVLTGDAATKLPAGLPVQAECDEHGG